jgi:hypothetical protein
MSIARERVVKHMPAEADERNNRCIARQRRGKQALSTIQDVFLWSPCKVDILVRKPSSEVVSCGRTRMERMRMRTEIGEREWCESSAED